MQAHHNGSGSAVRAHEELFAYWASRRQGGRLPGRGSIHPADFKRHLPTVSLIDVRHEPVRDYRLRLEDVYDETSVDYWRGQLDTVVQDRRPAVGFHSLSWRGASHLSLLWLRLPLAGDGCNVDMILGYDVLVGAPPEDRPTGIRAA